MSESKTAKKAILDKFRQILVFLYQRCPKKMSENAERPARSGRGSCEKVRPTTSIRRRTIHSSLISRGKNPDLLLLRKVV